MGGKRRGELRFRPNYQVRVIFVKSSASFLYTFNSTSRVPIAPGCSLSPSAAIKRAKTTRPGQAQDLRPVERTYYGPRKDEDVSLERPLPPAHVVCPPRCLVLRVRAGASQDTWKRYGSVMEAMKLALSSISDYGRQAHPHIQGAFVNL